jgi:hypothetical protein
MKAKAGVLLSLLLALNLQAADRPNIVMLFIDDRAWNDTPLSNRQNAVNQFRHDIRWKLPSFLQLPHQVS